MKLSKKPKKACAEIEQKAKAEEERRAEDEPELSRRMVMQSNAISFLDQIQLDYKTQKERSYMI